MLARVDPVAGLPSLLTSAPAGERSLLELAAVWPKLPEAHSRVAAKLRVFVINWDPLGWMGVPFEARATATGDGDVFELVLYVPLRDLTSARDPAGLLGEWCRSAVEVGVEQELLLTSGAYAQLVHAGRAPELLSATGTLSMIEPPQLTQASTGWEPIGLGAIQDLVQSELGPVDLDRSSVAFDLVTEPAAGCLACAGRRFGFPAELSDAQPHMCPGHADQAAVVIAERAERAEASNPDGWHTIIDASAALSAPTHGLPLELLDRLQDAIDGGLDEDTTAEHLRAHAAAAVELADQLRGRPAGFQAWVEDSMAQEWMIQLPWDLARRELLDDATRVADAFAELDRDHRSLYANDAALTLADAGRADAACARIETSLREFPRDLWTRVHAGDVYQTVGDLDRAEQEFRHAATLADAQGDRYDTATVAQRLAELLKRRPGRENEALEAAQHSLALQRGQRITRRPGRNEPCPCDSGRKYKKCCGA